MASFGIVNTGQGSAHEDAAQPGRYRFVGSGWAWGYRYDTATGAVWRVYADREEVVSEAIVDDSTVGRFEILPVYEYSLEQGTLATRMTPYVARWYLVDTMTGRVWYITQAGIFPMGATSEQ